MDDTYKLGRNETTGRFVPIENKMEENVILIRKDEDGNWSGRMMRFGKLIQVRDISPETVLVKLLTSDGN